ncbi:hypothetical protein Taro_007670 [Colocasia esculenta]|uniref:Uncharacterized protein n=1 Tax=Colocasia esculenta TaxID=4460 RepID=A0A843U0A7_COLES|nr:hypothetical protein [Colocasia esculenta]
MSRDVRRGEQQAPAPQGLTILPPPPPVDYGVFMKGLSQAPAPVPQEHGHDGSSIIEKFKRMPPPSFKGESQPLLTECWMREVEKIFRAISTRSETAPDFSSLCREECQPQQRQQQQQRHMTWKPGRPRAQARVYAIALEDAKQAENIIEEDLDININWRFLPVDDSNVVVYFSDCVWDSRSETDPLSPVDKLRNIPNGKKPEEYIREMFARFTTITNNLKALRKEYTSSEIVKKVLYLPPTWHTKAMVSDDSKNMATLTF